MLIGVFEQDGKVVLDFDDAPRVMLTWREAAVRGRAVIAAEANEPVGRRMRNFNKIIEGLIAAIRDARKKDDPTYVVTGHVQRYSAYRVPLALDPDETGKSVIIPISRGTNGVLSPGGLILP